MTLLKREVWRKKIQLGNKVPTVTEAEVIQQRKESNAAKTILKGKGIQTRIHWETGTRTYNSTEEVKGEAQTSEKTPTTMER